MQRNIQGRPDIHQGLLLKNISNQHTETEIKWQLIVVSPGRGNKDGNLRLLNG